jgi:L-lactate dehydrogenase (cytochrome)
VFVGRPFAYAAVGRRRGAALRTPSICSTQEVSRDMAMLGVNGVDEIDAAVHLLKTR